MMTEQQLQEIAKLDYEDWVKEYIDALIAAIRQAWQEAATWEEKWASGHAYSNTLIEAKNIAQREREDARKEVRLLRGDVERLMMELAHRDVLVSRNQPAPLDAPGAPVKPDATIRDTGGEWHYIWFDEDELPPHARVNPASTIRGTE